MQAREGGSVIGTADAEHASFLLRSSCHQNLSTSSDLEMKREGERERENLSSDNNHVKHFNHVKTREIFLIFYMCQMLITDLIVVFILHSCCLGFFIFRFIKIASNMHYTITTIYVHISNSRSSYVDTSAIYNHVILSVPIVFEFSISYRFRAANNDYFDPAFCEI